MALVYGTGPTLSSVVTNTQDSGVGSLRAAMYYAIDHPGTTITFNIPNSDPHYTNGVLTIQPTDGFPSVLNNTTINGATQSGNPSGPSIQLNGALAQLPGVFPNGLHLAGSNSTINALVVNGFAATGILIDGASAVANKITGCYLGIDSSGSFAITNGFCPLTIQNGARSNVVGGITVAARNVISGSTFQGMTIRDFGTDYNVVEGNYFGLNSTGISSVPNLWTGLSIFGGARSNIVGGTNFAAHNVISGNNNQGISDTNSDGNIINGNYIGLAPSGTTAIPNGWSGVAIFGGAHASVIGANFISGNGNQGVVIADPGTRFNVVAGNYIGLDAFGQDAIPNSWSGIAIFNGAQSNTVGGLNPLLRNVISGNANQGVVIADPNTSGNIIEGNFIGTNPNGTSAISNAWAGIEFFNWPSGNSIGGTTAAARNIISGNGIQGVNLNTCSNNVVQGNYIGVDVNGTNRIPNQASGILFYNQAQSNVIAANVISGNGNQGIAIFDSGTTSNLVAGNFIGVAANGTTAISNTWSGVELGNGAQNNLVGGGPGARNIISGNGNYGMLIAGANTSFNVVQGNSIGVNSMSMSAVPNSFAGIILFGGAQSNLIGGTIAGNANIIANNLSDGIQLFDTATFGNTIRGNSIVSNSGAGLMLYNNSNSNAPSPVLTNAIVSTNTTIRGNLTGTASTTYHLDFYSSPASSPQAMVYLGSRDATTAGNGFVAFTNSFSALIPAGRVITATATDPRGNTSSLSTSVTIQGTSTVNDGIPDAWRARYFGGGGTTTNSQSCATCDPDHDGVNNFQEFISGTNPTNATSALVLSESNSNQLGGITSFLSSSGIVYRLEFRNDFNIPGWSVLTDQMIGTGTNIVVSDPASATVPYRFYRARVLY
jgi:titin